MTDPVQLDPSYIEQARRAFDLHARGELEAADTICQTLIAGGPPFRDILHLKGLLDIKLGKPQSAKAHLEQADALEPGVFNVLFQLALAYEQLEDLDKAVATWERAGAVQPDDPVPWIKRAYGLRKLGQIAEAGRCVDEALKLAPENPSINHEKGYHLHIFEQDWDAAEPFYRFARDHSPDAVETWVNYALMNRSRGQWPELKKRMEEAHQQFPHEIVPRYYLGMEQLREGDFKSGWPNYEGRYQRPEVRRVDLQFKIPIWDGAPLEDTHLLFWTDQGIGEELLGLHIAAPQIYAARRATLVCSEAVQSIAERCFPDCEVVTHESIWDRRRIPIADVQASFSQIAVHSIPTPNAAKALPHSITPNPNLVAEFRDTYRADEGPLIGFAWKSPKSRVAANKSTELADWEPILSIPELRFVCLQYGVLPEERTWLRDRLGDRIFFEDSLVQGEDMDRWMAQVAATDLAISVSTTTAHLAGASRTPAWTLLTAGDGLTWYWLLDRSDCPWYAETTLYRQSQPTEWSAVFQAVERDLRARFHI